ncbi:hypothetical protein [Pseudonocardia sp. N23]|uniref:hypothetical protein n=1 Tax=Pseudonocardia sp. N23 TaxID=1987376 RepID=UPI000BFD525F|nr:hypothetical protein [Pseudonocardia sp. N23]GAY09346.1 hypothetical protein TOK_3305 [Pseudonocardia sp. N23]
MIVFVALGITALTVVSVIVGRLSVADTVEARRAQQTRKHWDLYRWEQELLNAAEVRGCPSCRLLRRRAELHADPPSE